MSTTTKVFGATVINHAPDADIIIVRIGNVEVEFCLGESDVYDSEYDDEYDDEYDEDDDCWDDDDEDEEP